MPTFTQSKGEFLHSLLTVFTVNYRICAERILSVNILVVRGRCAFYLSRTHNLESSQLLTLSARSVSKVIRNVAYSESIDPLRVIFFW